MTLEKRPEKDQEKDINIMKHTPKILLTLIFIGFLMTSCVTKKKLKESQELQSTYIIDQTEKKFTNSIKTIKSELKESLVSEFKETLKSFKESTSTNENESTSITATTTAEDGKEKTLTSGNTTIKTDGFNVKVETTSNKSTDKKLETINKELTQSLNEERNARISLENEFKEFKTAQLKVNEELKAEKKAQSKETNKKGLPFWVIIIAILLVLLFVAIKYFKVKIPFIN